MSTELDDLFATFGAPASIEEDEEDELSQLLGLFEEPATAPEPQAPAPVSDLERDMATLDEVGLGGAARFVKSLPTIPARIASSYKKGEATDSVVEGIGSLRQHLVDVEDVVQYLTPEGTLTPEGEAAQLEYGSGVVAEGAHLGLVADDAAVGQ